MRYRFFDRTPEALIETSEMPVEGGIALAVRATGYELGADEVVQLSIADMAGEVLFSQKVKPQNVEAWEPSRASGGITPADVEDAPELFQFEDEISGLFENASVVVAEHASFATSLIEASWVSLPPCRLVDLTDLFCTAHSDEGYPDKPATAASLESIAAFYGVDGQADEPSAEARAVAACYRALVAEHAAEREAKGPEYWEAYERRREEEKRADVQLQASERAKAKKTLLINAFMWLCAAAIFSNLAVQLSLRAADVGFVVVMAAVAVFCAIQWARCLFQLRKTRS